MKQFARRLMGRPAVASLLLTVVAFAALLGIFRPGYWNIDDIKIVWNAIGYPVGAQVPFLIHTNVLIGFLMMPLYALHTSVNWEIVFLLLVDAAATWALLYLIFSSTSAAYRAFAAVLVVAAAIYLFQNITYTITASWACAGGTAMLLAAARSGDRSWSRKGAVGVVLVLVGSMIRIQSLLPVIGFAAPGILLVLWRSSKRRTLLALLVAGMAVVAGYGIDRLYVRLFPDWNYYYHYNSSRELLHDAHRLENAGFQIRRVGWSANDQELFAHWFFPDPHIYSLAHIQYLDDHIPGTSQNLRALITLFTQNLVQVTPLPSVILILAAVLWALGERYSKWAVAAAVATWLIAMLENIVLAWAFKDPDHLLVATLVGSVAFGLVLVELFRVPAASASAPGRRSAASVILGLSSVMLLVAAILILNRAAEQSQLNTQKQAGYHSALAELRQLQSNGLIAKDGLIISPAHGLPIEWANPLVLDLPPVPYYDTGWVTFSPPYEAALQKYGIGSLADALYQKHDLYLMTQSSFTSFLGRYYQEHENRTVEFVSIYAMPNTYGIPGYDDIHLYKLCETKDTQCLDSTPGTGGG